MENNEKDFSGIFKYASVITILSAALGLVIINLHLQEYSIVDFYIIKPQIIYVGLIFIIVVLASSVIYLLFLDLKNPEKTGFFKIIGLSLVKLLILGNTLNFFFNKEDINKLLESTSISPLERMAISGSSVGGITILMITIFLYEFYIKKEINRGIRITLLIMLSILFIVSIGGAILCINNLPSTRSIFNFEIYIGSLITFGYIGYFALAIDQKKGFDTSGVSLYRTEVGGKVLFDTLFIYLYILLTLLILLKSYSKNIYPYISPSYGGGRPQSLCLINEGDTIKGQVIFQNNTYIFIKRDSSILILDWKNINSILLSNKKKL